MWWAPLANLTQIVQPCKWQIESRLVALRSFPAVACKSTWIWPPRYDYLQAFTHLTRAEHAIHLHIPCPLLIFALRMVCLWWAYAKLWCSQAASVLSTQATLWVLLFIESRFTVSASETSPFRENGSRILIYLAFFQASASSSSINSFTRGNVDPPQVEYLVSIGWPAESNHTVSTRIM